jgi:hypothetical protein
MLNESQIDPIFDKLCVEFGFCLSSQDKTHLKTNMPKDASSFADAIFMAEGLDPDLANRKL